MSPGFPDFPVLPISIHAPTRGATGVEIDCWLKGRFQSTLPRGERRPTVLDPVMGMHFNPRSHEGSDRKYGKPVKVSIEFQSTLPRGERPYTGGYGGSVTDFNPRSHEGSDCFYFRRYLVVGISIHAPTRGATLFPAKCTPFSSFQSTLPRGERHHPGCKPCDWKNFNPRSHEGSDSNRPCSALQLQNFNPRSHEGSDFG